MRFCTSGYDLCYVPVGTGIDPLEVWIMIRYSARTGDSQHMDFFVRWAGCTRRMCIGCLTYRVERDWHIVRCGERLVAQHLGCLLHTQHAVVELVFRPYQ